MRARRRTGPNHRAFALVSPVIPRRTPRMSPAWVTVSLSRVTAVDSSNGRPHSVHNPYQLADFSATGPQLIREPPSLPNHQAGSAHHVDPPVPTRCAPQNSLHTAAIRRLEARDRSVPLGGPAGIRPLLRIPTEAQPRSTVRQDVHSEPVAGGPAPHAQPSPLLCDPPHRATKSNISGFRVIHHTQTNRHRYFESIS